jgi:hypothetical protein
MAGRRPRAPDLLDQALTAARGSRRIERKPGVDLDDAATWCDLLRDVAAMANTGGGVIVVGLDRTGRPTGWDPDALLRIDPGRIIDKLAEHLGERFEEISIVEATKAGDRLAAIQVGARTGSPLVFERPCAYRDAEGLRREAFARGTVYFRHGAKSEPALARDLARFAGREERQVRQEMIRHLRRVSSAPLGSQVLVVPPSSAPTTAIERVRVVDDPDAPAVARADYDVTHPHRQKDVVAAVNGRFGRALVNTHDLLCVRRVHDVDARDALFHKPKFGSPQYSDAFIDWLVASFGADPSFFDDAKAEYRRRQLARRAGG